MGWDGMDGNWPWTGTGRKEGLVDGKNWENSASGAKLIWLKKQQNLSPKKFIGAAMQLRYKRFFHRQADMHTESALLR